MEPNNQPLAKTKVADEFLKEPGGIAVALDLFHPRDDAGGGESAWAETTTTVHVRVDNVIGTKFAMVSAPSIGTWQLPGTTGMVFKMPLVVRDPAIADALAIHRDALDGAQQRRLRAGGDGVFAGQIQPKRGGRISRRASSHPCNGAAEERQAASRRTTTQPEQSLRTHLR